MKTKIDIETLSFTLDEWEKHSDRPEKRAHNRLILLGLIPGDECLAPYKAKDCYYTKTLKAAKEINPEVDQYINKLVSAQFKKENDKKKKRARQKTLSHTKAMDCFERCVQIQAQRERNSLRRRARLLKAAKDLGLSAYLNRQEIAQRVLEAKEQAQGQGFQLLSAADRAAMAKPVVHWLVPGLVPEGDLTIIGGRPKVGKTRLAVAIAAAVLNGTQLLELPATATKAPVILCSDDQADGDTCEMLSALDLWQHPDLHWSRHFRLNERDLDGLLGAIKSNPGALVVIDSLRSISRCLQHGENDPEIGATLYDLKQAVTDAGGTLLLVHHCNKTNDLVGIEALSGHNAIAGAANSVLTMHHLEAKNGQVDKQSPQRRLVREARSGDGFDLVIDRDASAGFRRVSDVGEWKQQQEEASNREKLTTLQTEVLDAVNERNGEWMTRRDVCEAVGIEWTERGRTPDCQRISRSLQRLVQNGFIDSQRAGLESTFRSVASRESTKTLMTMMPSSHTNGSHGITPSDDSDDSDDKGGLVSSMSSVASNDVMTRKPLPALDGIDVITDSPASEPQEKVRRRTQLALAIPGASSEKQPDTGDPHWPERKGVA